MGELGGGAWRLGPDDLREEVHYGGRRVLCHARRPHSLGALVADTVARHGAREAVVAGGRRLSYRELDCLAGHAAAHLASVGIAPGERVAFLLCNCIEFAVY